MHSEGREDKQVHMYKAIIPGLHDRRLPSISPKLSGNFGIAALDFVTQFFFLLQGFFVFLLCVCTTSELKRRIMQIPSARCFVAVCLTLFGYIGDVYAGTILMNSNGIKNWQGASSSKAAGTVSPSPRTSPSGSMGHKSPADTLQVIYARVRKSQNSAPRRSC